MTKTLKKILFLIPVILLITAYAPVLPCVPDSLAECLDTSERAFGGSKKATQVYIAGGNKEKYDTDKKAYTEGYTLLNDGDTILTAYNESGIDYGYARFSNGNLTLYRYNTTGSAGYIKDGKLYSIYANGDLSISLHGSCEFCNTDTAADESNGIYLSSGDLEITNSALNPVTMKIRMDKPADKTSCGIYCHGFTIPNSGGDITLDVKAADVTDRNGRSYGIRTSSNKMKVDIGTIRSEGGNALSEQQSTTSAGLAVTGNFEMTGGTMDLKGGNAAFSYGFYQLGSEDYVFSISGGTVIARGVSNGKNNRYSSGYIMGVLL